MNRVNPVPPTALAAAAAPTEPGLSMAPGASMAAGARLAATAHTAAGSHLAAGYPGSPSARHILPNVVERTARGEYSMDPYSKLLKERIVFLGMPIDDAAANDIMAQLLYLDSENPDLDISMYINSPGGSFTAMTAVYDTMQYIRPDIATVCLGQAASAAAVLLAAGTPGKRLALPNSRVLIHQPSARGEGQSSDLEIQAREILRARSLMERILAEHTGRGEDEIRRAIERDTVFTADAARDHGLVDAVLTTRKPSRLARSA